MRKSVKATFAIFVCGFISFLVALKFLRPTDRGEIVLSPDAGASLLHGFLVNFALAGALTVFAGTDPISACMPAQISVDHVIEIKMRETAGGMVRDEVTVLDALKKLKAKCRKGKLVDRAGKPVSFFALRGCWGTPPANYRQILKKQEEELAALKKGNTVVEIPCNPDPSLPPSGRRPGGSS